MGTQRHYLFFLEMMLIRPERMRVSLGADTAVEKREVAEDWVLSCATRLQKKR